VMLTSQEVPVNNNMRCESRGRKITPVWSGDVLPEIDTWYAREAQMPNGNMHEIAPSNCFALLAGAARVAWQGGSG
jgi:hypothetical protein